MTGVDLSSGGNRGQEQLSASNPRVAGRQRVGVRAGETMDQLIIDVAGVPIPAMIIRSARRSRTLAISVEAGTLKVRAPLTATNAQVIDMVKKRATWIAGRLRSLPTGPAEPLLANGETLPYLGASLTLRVALHAGRRVKAGLDGSTLLVELPAALPPAAHAANTRHAVSAWYRARAAEALPEVLRHWSAVSGLVPSRVLIRDQRRRWGSCAPDGTVRLNWRLILLAPRLAEYVVVHELAHLRHRHHQASFWQEVSRLMPDYLDRRRELSAAGRELVV